MVQLLGRVVLILISVVMACSLGVVVLLVFWSHPGTPGPFLDSHGSPLPGSISEKTFVNVNGAQLGMFIKSRDVANPVLLYLHGGMPEYFLTRRHPVRLEDHFTVVWWEQRGAGLSYSPAAPPTLLTAEQIIADVFEVTDYLRRRFGKEKIYLMAHSGGTFVGIQAAARRPQLYLAYIGVAQISHQLASEKRAYDYMLARYREIGDQSMVRKLEAGPVSLSTGVPETYLLVRDDAMHSLGVGTTREIHSVLHGIFLESLKCREYTLSEKVQLWRAKASSGVTSLWSEMIGTDLSAGVTEFRLPVYFLHGIHDYTVSYEEAKSYFRRIRAPRKGFYSFQRSAHSPVFEEPDASLNVLLKDVLAGTADLADSGGTLHP